MSEYAVNGQPVHLTPMQARLILSAYRNGGRVYCDSAKSMNALERRGIIDRCAQLTEYGRELGAYLGDQRLCPGCGAEIERTGGRKWCGPGMCWEKAA